MTLNTKRMRELQGPTTSIGAIMNNSEAATPKFEAKRHGASDHSNNCMLVPLANILPQTLQALLVDKWVMLYPSFRFAVGMPVAWHPPHRSQRAILSHWAPALSHHAKTLFWIRMIDTGDREPLVHVPLHTLPGDIAFVAPSRETTLPQPCNLLAESLQRLGIMRYAVVLIMAQYHRSEPSPLYRDGKVHSPPELTFHLSQLGAKALRDGAPFHLKASPANRAMTDSVG